MAWWQSLMGGMFGTRGIGFTSERTRRRLVDSLQKKGICKQSVLDAIYNTPRHCFLSDPALTDRAYDDIPLPIGYRQTISQPYVVALMTETLLGESAGIGRVLEIGTGSGYQAAVLSFVAKRVYTVERIRSLFETAKTRLAELGIDNVEHLHGDGYQGWPGRAPYDAIILTSAPEKVPNVLLRQLTSKGHLIAPVGIGDKQRLITIARTDKGYRETCGGAVRFVPMLPGVQT